MFLAVTLLLATAAAAPRDVLPDLPHERVDYWVERLRPEIEAAFSRLPQVEAMIAEKLRLGPEGRR